MNIEVKEAYGEKRRFKGQLTINMKGEATLAVLNGLSKEPVEVHKLSRSKVEYMMSYGMIVSGVDLTQDPPLYQEWDCRYPKDYV
jgi:hypothetical protein